MIRKGIEVEPRSREKIREEASDIRKLMFALTRDASPKFDILKFLDIALPQIMPSFVLEVRTIGEMQSNHGLTFPDTGIMNIREDVFLGAHGGNARDRMTLAHELGHLILHKNIALPKRYSPPSSTPRYRDSEWQADCFGAELLVDHSQINICRSASDVMKVFGVSMAAAQYQWSVRNNG